MFKKKLLGAALSLAMAASTAVPALAATGFSDVADDGSALATAVQRLNSLKIMQGSPAKDGTLAFNGSGAFTRAQAAKVFVVARGLGSVKSNKAIFTDVSSSAWYFNYVNVAQNYGIVAGSEDAKGNKVFNPNKDVTLGELATMALRTLGYKDEDLDESGEYNVYSYVQKAADLGLFTNVDNVDVESAATRADVAQVVNALLDTPTKTEQAKADNSTATPVYVAKSFFETVATKFGVKAITGSTFTATSASDSGLKANQFKMVVDGTTNTYTLPNASEDFSGNFYKTYSGKFYVSTKDASQVVFFDNASVKGAVKDAGSITSAPAATTLRYTDSSSNNTDYTLAATPVVVVNGAASSIANLDSYIAAGKTVTVKLVNNDSDANNVYEAVVATVVNKPVKVYAAPTSDDAKTVGSITYGAGSESITLMKDASTAASVYVTGAATKLTEIKADDIVYVKTVDDKSAVTLDVFRAPVAGTVSGTTLTSGVVTAVTIAGVSYPVSASVLATINGGSPLGVKGTFVVDKDKNVFKFTSDADSISATAPTVGGAVYGIVTAVANASKDAWGSATLPKVKFFKLDGTTAEITVTQANYDANFATFSAPVFAYYTTLDTTNGTAFSLPAKVTYSASNLVSDTKVVRIDSSNVPSIVKSTDYSTPTSVWVAKKNGNTMGDYYAIVMDSTTTAVAPAATTVGYVSSYAGQTLVGTVTADVYNVYENGVAKVVKATVGLLTPGTVYTGLTTGTDGVTTAVAKVDVVLSNAIDKSKVTTDTVDVIDAATSRVKFTNGGIRTIASNVVVFKTGVPATSTTAATTPAVGTLSDVAATNSVTYYLNSDGNVQLIVVAK